MAASVKTLLENPGELYWGTHQDDPEYHYGIALDYRDGTLVAQAVYVLTDYAEEGEDGEGERPLVTPELLMSCFTVADLEANGIVLTDNMDDEADEGEPEPKGWYCIELSIFRRDDLEALRESSERCGGCLDIVLQILGLPEGGAEAAGEELGEYDFFDMQEQLGGISDLIDRGMLQRPLPFQFRLIGDALMGWQTADEEDFR